MKIDGHGRDTILQKEKYMITTIEQVKKYIEDHYINSLEYPIKVSLSSSGDFVEIRNDYDHDLLELPIIKEALDYAVDCIEENAIDFAAEEEE
jgi:hypothetical protein